MEQNKNVKKQVEDSDLRLIVYSSAKEQGEKIDRHLIEMYGLDPNLYTFIIPIKESFFEDGHLKVEIEETVRGKDVFFLTDIGNYSLEYTMHGFTNHTSPNDLMVQLKDGIGASNRHADFIRILMPLLYAGRQHRRKTRENLACAMFLHEIDEMSGMKSFVTFDAHDPAVEQALHKIEFDNVFPTNTILERFINDLNVEELRKVVFIAPDNGATGRRDVYLNSFNSEYIDVDAGSFYKKRDYNHLVNGKYEIISHDYLGSPNLEGRTAIVSDDMISSGGSMFDVIDELNERGIEHIYIVVTYALFTRGIDKFKEYFEAGKFDGIYTTDLSYIPKEYQQEWLHICDCSEQIARVVYHIHRKISLSPILSDRSFPVRLLEEKFKKYLEEQAPSQDGMTLTRNKPTQTDKK